MLPNLTLLAYFEQRRSGLTPGVECHIWTGSRNSNGYGKVTLNGVGTYYTHRIAYGIAHGYVPMEIDHLCRHRACFNPVHLDAVTHLENVHRAGHTPTRLCINGHRWSEVGWYENGAQGRKCKACHREIARRSAQRRKASTPVPKGQIRPDPPERVDPTVDSQGTRGQPPDYHIEGGGTAH